MVKNTVIVSGDLTFKVISLDTMRVRLTAGTDEVIDLVVPDQISAGGLTFEVTSVAEGAFEGHTDLKSVDLGSVLTVYASAFAGCTGLEKVVFPDTLTTLYKSAFDVDFHKGSKILSETVKNLKGRTFSGSGGHLYLDGSVIKNTVIVAGDLTFKVVALDTMRVRLTAASETVVDLVVPDQISAGGLTFDVTSVAEGAFDGRTDLKSVDLGSVLTVYASAFAGCTGLEKVVFPDTLKTLYGDAFDVTFCSGEKELAKTVKNLKGKTFEGTDGILVLTS